MNYTHLQGKTQIEINDAFALAGKKDRVYPIYSFSAHWSQDGIQNPEYPKWDMGLPPGRIWNSTSFRKMYKVEQSQEELDTFIKMWWKNFYKSKSEATRESSKIINPVIDYLKAEFVKFDTWYLTWFQHETFDNGQTDEEALASFQEYVRRVERTNQELEDRYGDDNEKYKHGYETLMGAEDRWRWCGAGANGDEHTSPPCRCKFCKEQGVLRIGH